MIVCTPKWLEQKLADRAVVSGHHHLIVKCYDIAAIRSFLVRYAEKCSGETCQDVAKMLLRLGGWCSKTTFIKPQKERAQLGADCDQAEMPMRPSLIVSSP
jgi:hypothetical protein